MKNLDRYHYLLLGIWTLINFIQAISTGLHSDESYYWMYSQHLDWGYFDHPPMVALLIFLGSSLLPGEIGVRLLFVLLSTLSLALILYELKEKRNHFFLTVFVFSFPLVHTHIAGFLAIPDIPLIFFSLLFLIAYKNFIQNQNWQNMVILGLIIPAMIYSKYHAFLIIGFTLISNIKLLKSKYFYGIVLISILLLIPHILWQINNQFPTFRYHLVERAKPLQLKYLSPYILGTIAVIGPLTAFVMFWKLFRIKIEYHYPKALRYNIIGFLILFFVMSFKNRIEIHWLSAIIPMIIFLTYPIIQNDTKTQVWFNRFAIPVILLLLLFRVYIAFDVLPNVGSLKITFYNRKKSALEIKELANGKSVGFFNNYAAISNYIFYTHDPAVHLSTPNYRFCQYDFWNDENRMNNKSLFAIQSKNLNPPSIVKLTTGEEKGFIVIENFQPLNGLTIEIQKIIDNQNNYDFTCILHNTNSYPLYTNHISAPVLAIMVNKVEIASIPLLTSTEPERIKEHAEGIITFSLCKTLFQKITHFQIYTRTKENIRGEFKSVEITDFLN